MSQLRLRQRPRPLFAFVTLNITERKQSEQALRETMELNQIIIETSAVGIAAFNAGGRCIFVNQAMAAITGGTVAQIRQQDFRHLESWRKSGMLKMAEWVLESGRSISKEIPSVTSFGRAVFIELSMSRFVSRGQPHLLVMVNDITANNPNRIKLSVNTANGEVLGTFAPNPGTPLVTRQIRAIALQNTNVVAGFFIGTNQSGSFSLESR